MSNQSFKPWVDIKSVLHLRWLAPFLTVPVLYVASVFIESWLQESGMIAYVPVGKRLIFSLWRIVMIVALVATPIVTMFLKDSWKKLKNQTSNFTGHFFSPVLVAFVLVSVIMIVSSMIILYTLGVPVSSITQILFTRCLFTALWVVGAATLCSSITDGPSGAVLSLGLFSLALLPGLTGTPVSWWFVAPLGEMVKTIDSISNAWNITLFVFAHSMLYLTAGFFILKNRITDKSAMR